MRGFRTGTSYAEVPSVKVWGSMSLKSFSLGFVVSLLVAFPALADEKIRFRFCNNDETKPINVSFASYKLSVHTTHVEGWYRAEPGKCRDLWLWDSTQYTHHFVFSSAGKVLKLGPKEYELFGIRSTLGLNPSDESFCTDMKRGYEISETIFALGRAKTCVGDEVLTPFSLKMAGGRASEVKIDLPALAGK